MSAFDGGFNRSLPRIRRTSQPASDRASSFTDQACLAELYDSAYQKSTDERALALTLLKRWLETRRDWFPLAWPRARLSNYIPLNSEGVFGFTRRGKVRLNRCGQCWRGAATVIYIAKLT